MKKIILFGILVLIVLISGCEVSDELIKDVTGDVIKENIDKLVVCESPYIRHGTECCLDSNNNKICDKDEQITQPEQEPETTISCDDVRISLEQKDNTLKITNKGLVDIDGIDFSKHEGNLVTSGGLYNRKLSPKETYTYKESLSSIKEIQFIPTIIKNNRAIQCVEKSITWTNPTPNPESYSLECTSNCDRGVKITSQEYQESRDGYSHQFLATLKNENPRDCGTFCLIWEGIYAQPSGDDREDLITLPSVGGFKVITLRTNKPTEFRLVCSDESASEKGCDSRIKQIFKVG